MAESVAALEGLVVSFRGITARRMAYRPSRSLSILTTVTDVVGIFAFPGIVTLLSGML